MDEKFRENVFGRGVRLAGALVARASPAAHATISWDFIEQSIPVCTAGNFVTGVGWVCAVPSSPRPMCWPRSPCRGRTAAARRRGTVCPHQF
jgi:hypothetical protein